MQKYWAVLLGVASISLASGCKRSTTVLYPAHAEAGRTGFGQAQHTTAVFLVFASVIFTEVGTAVAASSPETGTTGEFVWRVHRGGGSLELCGSSPEGEPHCVSPEWEAGDPGGLLDVYLIVDPVNLDQTLWQSEVTGVSLTRTRGGSIAFHGHSIPAGATSAIWVVTRRKRVDRCEVGASGPVCRPARVDGEPVVPDAVLGSFALREANGEISDVIWIAKRRQVYRCVANRQSDAPTCTSAQL